MRRRYIGFAAVAVVGVLLAWQGSRRLAGDASGCGGSTSETDDLEESDEAARKPTPGVACALRPATVEVGKTFELTVTGLTVGAKSKYSITVRHADASIVVPLDKSAVTASTWTQSFASKVVGALTVTVESMTAARKTVASCSAAVTAPTQSCPPSPTGIPSSFDAKMGLYDQVPVNTGLCELVMVRPGSQSRKYEKWNCSEEDCVKECTADAVCKFVLFSADAHTCIKAVSAYVIDEPAKIDDWVSNHWVAYRKHDTGVQPYVSGFCAGFKGKSSCESAGNFCGWNKGRKGENHMADFAGGYCGRILCPQSPTK